jgi:hypothetical protein
MSEELPEMPKKNQKTDFVIVLAAGTTAAKRAARTGVPRRTAYNWAGEPEVQSMKETIRRRTIDRVVGTLASSAVSACSYRDARRLHTIAARQTPVLHDSISLVRRQSPEV